MWTVATTYHSSSCMAKDWIWALFSFLTRDHLAMGVMLAVFPVPYVQCPCSDHTRLWNWPRFWFQLHLCKGLRLHFAQLWHYCSDKICPQTDRHVIIWQSAHNPLPWRFLVQHVSPGPHFAMITQIHRLRGWRQYQATLSLQANIAFLHHVLTHFWAKTNAKTVSTMATEKLSHLSESRFDTLSFTHSKRVVQKP